MVAEAAGIRGRAEVGLTEHGREQAEAVGAALRDRHFALVLRDRSVGHSRTCRLAGFGDRAVQRDELMEWDYGAYEGQTTAEVREERPGSTLWGTACRTARRSSRSGSGSTACSTDLVLLAATRS